MLSEFFGGRALGGGGRGGSGRARETVAVSKAHSYDMGSDIESVPSINKEAALESGSQREYPTSARHIFFYGFRT